MGLMKRWRKRIRTLVRGDAVERELDQELAIHLEMETEKNLRAGMSRDEARRRAAIAFGGVEKFKEGVRDARTLGWTTGMALDIRLGVRMLRKYPALTWIGGFAMAFAILVGAVGFELATRFVFPSLPIVEGERVVTIQNWTATSRRAENPTPNDVVHWREALSTIEDLGAFRKHTFNLIAADRAPTLVGVVEVTAPAFELARVRPLLGRPLTADDERPDAVPVVVIGYALWQRHFDGDDAIIGRTLRLGRSVHTIVGVMPERFESPTGGALWLPLRLDVAQRQPGDPRLRVIGRLARGITIAQAQTELTTVGRNAASPDHRGPVTPRIEPYATSLLRQLSPLELVTVTLFLTLLVVIICANVALLMFARAAAREGEMVVRSALGATRRRIIWQLFAEALVLAGIATAVGLIAADGVLRWGFGLIDVTLGPDSGAPGFWDRTGISLATVLYACLLAALAALIAGVVPALKVTGALDGRLRMATAGGGGFRFGGVWTAVVVVQVAAMVAFPVLAVLVRGEAEDIRAVQHGFASEEFLSARVEMDRETALGAPIDASGADFAARFGAALRELENRLEAEGAAAGVTFSDGPLLISREPRAIELEGGASVSDADNSGLRIKSATVAPDYFELLNAPAIAGRSFRAADTLPGTRVAVVNQSFVDGILGGANAIGRRVRYASRPGPGDAPPDAEPWHEIIGVVRDIGRPAGGDSAESAGIYHPASPETAIPAHLLVHVKGRPESFVPRLRSLAAAVDPGLRIHEAVPLNEVRRVELHLVRLQFWLVTGLSGGALLLSLAGIHSVLSFTVSQRTREIGLRVALGGEGWRVAATIARRPLAQVAAGVLLGGALTAAMLDAVDVARSASGAARLLAYLGLMLGVSLLAAIVPARRVLRIEPTEALKTES